MQFEPSEDAIIRDHYITKSASEIGLLLGRPAASVASRAKQMMRSDEQFRRVVSQRVADRNVRKLRAAVAAGKKNARNERLFGGPTKPIVRDAAEVTLPKAPNRELRPVVGRSSEEMTRLAVERVAKRKATPKRRCSYFHFNPEKGRSAQCAEFAAKGSAWCPECAARIAELRASA